MSFYHFMIVNITFSCILLLRSSSPDLLEQLINELERVGRERDDLTALMKSDAASLGDRIASVTKQGIILFLLESGFRIAN